MKTECKRKQPLESVKEPFSFCLSYTQEPHNRQIKIQWQQSAEPKIILPYKTCHSYLKALPPFWPAWVDHYGLILTELLGWSACHRSFTLHSQSYSRHFIIHTAGTLLWIKDDACCSLGSLASIRPKGIFYFAFVNIMVCLMNDKLNFFWWNEWEKTVTACSCMCKL